MLWLSCLHTLVKDGAKRIDIAFGWRHPKDALGFDCYRTCASDAQTLETRVVGLYSCFGVCHARVPSGRCRIVPTHNSTILGIPPTRPSFLSNAANGAPNTVALVSCCARYSLACQMSTRHNTNPSSQQCGLVVPECCSTIVPCFRSSLLGRSLAGDEQIVAHCELQAKQCACVYMRACMLGTGEQTFWFAVTVNDVSDTAATVTMSRANESTSVSGSAPAERNFLSRFSSLAVIRNKSLNRNSTNDDGSLSLLLLANHIGNWWLRW
jgi:hypothetical protein